MSEEVNETHDKVLNPTVVKLGFVSLLADISSEMLYPITPLFLTGILGASMLSVGLIEGVAEVIASTLKFYSGKWSDRIIKRKPFIGAGYLISALAKPLIGISTTWIGVLFARGFDRTGKGLRGAPRDALLSESVPERFRGQAFGWHRAMDTLGAAIGPLIAVIYLTYFSADLRSIYFIALIPGLAAVAVVMSIKEKKSGAEFVKKRSAGPKLRLREISRDFKIYLLSWGIFSLVNSSDVFLLLKAKESGLELNTVIFMYCFYNLTYALMSPYFGKLSDRVPRKKVLAFGLLIFCLVYLGFSFSTSNWHYWFLFGIYGLYMAATDGVGKALAVDLVSAEHKASGLGLLSAVTGVASVVASTMAGLLWDKFGSGWAFLYGSFGALCSIFLLLLIRRGQVPPLMSQR